MPHTTPDVTRSSLLATAREAASAAARIHRDALAQGGQTWVSEKSTFSDFVSDVDMAAQKAALDVIVGRHPTHEIMAEEDGGGRAGETGNEYVWVVDPLDGTTNFLHGHPFHAASVAVWDPAGPLAAVVDAQALDCVWTASRDGGAFRNGEPIAVSQARDPSRFLLGTGFPFKSLDVLDPFLGQLGRALTHTAGVRRTGAAALDLAYVASGILDGFWESWLAPWDFAAGILLVTEAGGRVERVEGGTMDLTPGTVLSANSPSTLEVLRDLLLATEGGVRTTGEPAETRKR